MPRPKRAKEPDAGCESCLMGATVLGERGQVVIPKDIRKRLKLGSGDRLMVLNVKNGPIILVPMDRMRSFVAHVNQQVSAFLRDQL